MSLSTFIVASIFLSPSLLTKCVLGTVVLTTNGAVRGGQSTTIDLGLTYFFYRGIPYAEPPVGPLRFQAPVPKGNWDGIRDGTADGPPCVGPFGGVENCLSINVYTPTEPSESCQLLPVMLWIYGGGFSEGNASYASYGPDYFLEKNIVVVTFNYRTGVLGFLSTADDVAPGNAGLKDQLLAMKWARDNIASFCGDPNRVTIAGQSAGAVSVAYHLQSPQSQGLFQAAILDSGVSLCLWGLSRKVPDVVKQIAIHLGVSIANSSTIVQGLQSVNATKLQETAASVVTTWYITNNPRDGYALGPVAEPNHPGAFFTGASYPQLENGQFAQVPILMGFNTLEGTFEYDLIFRVLVLTYDLIPTRLLPIDANVVWYKQLSAAESIERFYFGLGLITLSDIQLMQYLSDDQFVRPIVQFARLTQRSVPVYFYRFSYEGGLYGIYNRTAPGVAHSEDLGYLWRSYFAPQRNHDLVVRSRMVTMWCNFVKNRNPTPVEDPVLQNVIWSTFDGQRKFLDIGYDLILGQQVWQPNVTFWDGFYATYGRPPYDTY